MIDEIKNKEDFNNIFAYSLSNNFAVLEADHILNLFIGGEINELRIFLDDITDKSKQKVLDALEKGESDSIYEKRYKDVKNLNDLFTYYCDIMIE